MHLRRLLAMVVLAAPLLAVAGCAQGLGDRCQVQSDCADLLICVLPAGGTPQAGGTCQPMINDAGALDMMVGSDMAAGNVGADMTNLGD